MRRMMIPRRDNVAKNKYKDFSNLQDKCVTYDNNKYLIFLEVGNFHEYLHSLPKYQSFLAYNQNYYYITLFGKCLLTLLPLMLLCFKNMNNLL